MEIWDLYDVDRNLADKKMIRGERTPEGYYRLVVGICIFNSRGEMLVQKRQPFKKGWSGLWDISVGGAAVEGETNRVAAEREVREELGLDISLANIAPKVSFTFPTVFADFYLLNMDVDLGALTLQYEEVERVAWATREEIHEMIDRKEFIPYEKSIIDMMFYFRNHKDTHTEGDFTTPSAK
jgi:isopentenyldiphosphate isomerase